MGFRNGARFVKVWDVEDKGNYHVVSLTTSKKDKNTGAYETDFSWKFVRFIGTAHNLAANLKKGDTIKLGDCESTVKYDKDKNTTYHNYMVYSFEMEGDSKNTSSTNSTNNKSKDGFAQVADDDEELPFM